MEALDPRMAKYETDSERTWSSYGRYSATWQAGHAYEICIIIKVSLSKILFVLNK